MTITEPGIYDIPIGDYVADPCKTLSLSASIAKLLLERSPAHAHIAHPRLTQQWPEKFSSAANLGTAVHAQVFGGDTICWIDAANYLTKAAKEQRDNALVDGKIPMLEGMRARVGDIAQAARAAIGRLPTMTYGFEKTIIWKDGETWLRARPDALADDYSIIIDLKTTGVSARDCNRQFFAMGYDMQAAFLERAVDSIDPDGRGKRQIFYLFVEVEPPFGAVTLLISEATMMIARKKMNAAINLWRQCVATRTWPGYPNELEHSDMPGWLESQWLEREMNDPSVEVEV